MGLDSLGIGAVEQRVYEVLLDNPGVTLARLSELTALGEARLRTLARSLADKGMVSRTSDRPPLFVAAPPDLAIEVLALRRQEEIEQARLAAAVLGNRVRRESLVNLPVEAVRGHDAVANQFRQVQHLARTELCILDKPPYLVQPDDAQRGLQQASQARGVRYRTIYDREALGTARRFEELRQLAAFGEEARVLDEVPMKLVIADRRVGLVPHGPPGHRHAMLVRTSALLDGLGTLFDTLWERATPLWPHSRRRVNTAELSIEDQQLLALLAAGVTDQAIARKLGVAKRTVERRVRRVMDGLGARTRFQAGLRAAGRGLFDNEPSATG